MTGRGLALALVLAAGCGGAAGERMPYETGAQQDARELQKRSAQRMKEAERLLAAGDSDGAAVIYRQVAAEDPRAVAPRQGLANLALRAHKYGEAERWLREIIAIDPEAAEPRYQLVNSLLRQRRIDDARKEFQAAQTTPGADERTELRLKATLALRSGKTTQAARLFDDYIAAYPEDPDGYVGLAVTLAAAGDLDEALVKLEQAAKLAPNSAVVEYDLALVYYRKGALDQAVAHGRRAVELDPGFLPARNNLASALLQQGQLPEAKAQLEASIKERPSYAPAHNNLGVVLLASGDLEGAAAAFLRAIHHAPRVSAFYFNLGITRFRQGKIDDARKQFERVVALAPNDAGARSNLSWLDGVKKGTIKGTDLPAMSSQYAVDEFDE